MHFEHRNIALLTLLSLCLTWSGGPAAAQVHLPYVDDFTTGQVQHDSYSHALYWPAGAAGPNAPHLLGEIHLDSGSNGLLLVGHKEKPAHLKYCFMLDQQAITGVNTAAMAFTYSENPRSPFPSFLQISVSADGIEWSPRQPLPPGPHHIPLDVRLGQCYVALYGSDAVISNLQVYPLRPPADIHVPGDFDLIQDAVGAAQPGQVIEVAPGVYGGDGNLALHLHGKPITLRSAAGAGQTIIDCADTGGFGAPTRAFYIHQGEGPDTVVAGFTIIHGRVPSGLLDVDAAAWRNNEQNPLGGGIYCEFAAPTISGCVFVDCQAQVGAAVAAVGSDPTFIGCTVRDCQSTQNVLDINGVYGGAMALLRNDHALVYGCEFNNNNVATVGRAAGLYCHNATVKIQHCHFNGNGLQNAALGGAVHIAAFSHVTIVNCLFRQNAAQAGAAVYLPVNEPAATGHVHIENCTFVENHLFGPVVANAGAALHAVQNDMLVTNSIFWQNDIPDVTIENLLTEVPLKYCNIQNSEIGAATPAINPFFAAPALGDFHLKSTDGRYDPNTGRWRLDRILSPGVDAGDPTMSMNAESNEHGGRRNIGVYGGTWQASRSDTRLIFHVDPLRPDGDHDGLTAERPLATVRQAIDICSDGDYVLLWPGVYGESIDLMGKAITLQSAGDPAVLRTPGDYAITCTRGEGPETVLRNLVITGGITGIFLVASNPTITQVTIADNDQYAIAAYMGAAPDISNSIFWNNATGDLLGCTARHSCRQTLVGNNQHNISVEPRFVDPAERDYHLLSQAGRFDPMAGQWVNDSVTSPCIDAGDPGIFPRQERAPNGGWLNLGAAGGSAYASRSTVAWPVGADVNRNGVVNLHDYALFVKPYSSSATTTPVNIVALAKFSEDWLWLAPWLENK